MPQSKPRLHHVEKNRKGRVVEAYDSVTKQAQAHLAQDLAKAIAGEVRFDVGSRALYATDASNYRQVPIGVVIPRTVEDVVRAMTICRQHGVPVVMRGGGTSLAGQGCNVAVLVDFSKYLDHVLSIDPDRRLAVVEPGCILDTLRDAAEKHHLTFGPDPATHDHNTLGGMLGNNSCGVHSVVAGRTSDNVESLDIVTYDGLRMTVGKTDEAEFSRILAGGGRKAAVFKALDTFRRRYGDLIRARFPKIPRRVSGYENLDQLLPENGFNVARALVGTEGTCVTILQASLNLIESPRERVLAIVGFDDIYAAADAVPEALEYRPFGLEGIDDLLIDFVRRKHIHPEDIAVLPEGGGWLVAEFGGENRAAAVEAARGLVDGFKKKERSVSLVDDPAKQKKVWELREAALAATAHVPDFPETWPGWEDSAVPRESLGNYLRDLKRLFHKHGYEASVYGHFGDGLVHCRVPFDLRTEAGLVNWQNFLEEAADLVVRYGGSLSGEHGDGQARAALLEKMYGPELMEAFRVFKAIWDPEGKMNPGKVIDPFPPISNLRVGPEYQPAEMSHYFAYREDGGSFTQAARRCVGVGACRRPNSSKSVMCPSYMATRDEKHSTRGRARLLFEMSHGVAITEGWQSNEVEEALNLCLGCKGCKHDCPVQVDMATYKAEFRAHHYAGRWRPRAAYSMGLIHKWSRVASYAPWLANSLIGLPGLSDLTKWIGGISPHRRMPRYAARSFRDWHRHRPHRNGEKARVILWPDTFNNYFRPGTAASAVTALEALGYEVALPDRPLCCGRPLYDWGMLDSAKALWRRTLESLTPEIAAGTKIIGLEPACVSAFRDELPALFPGDERAARLSQQTLFLSEFLEEEAEHLMQPIIQGKALVQLHCHQHAIVKPDAEQRILDGLGIDYEILSAGCCGMAGAFGFETEKYELSQTIANLALFPRLRQAPSSGIILANGFSCREQIEQGTGRSTLHIADLLGKALSAGRQARSGSTSSGQR
ncbi:FAD-binding and (Fe-S)-binding domain-containing protein [Dongia soli]|uniref:FAD-binding and (Fe-S)-binding domain-containing protein n=1 Tax=Dongia soli TaxID=600628 RepID=A0ABU5EDL4_9PROT|nr:FAD-binding and (Fe-S)-binding domain-containing protein [Dongia soli]MDY0884416.1 FAD-binding and (Fe-S)-binding domain-containing protein [Dongia soli]